MEFDAVSFAVWSAITGMLLAASCAGYRWYGRGRRNDRAEA